MELRLTIIIWLYSLAVLHSPSTPLCGLIVTLYFYRRKSPTKKIMKRGLVCLMQHSVKTLTCSARAGTQHHAGLVIDPTSQDVSHPSLCLPHHFIFVRQPHVTLQHFILCHHEPRSRFGRRDGNMNLQLDTSILKYLVHPIMIGFRFLFSVVRWFVFHRQYRRPAFCTLKIQTHERWKKRKKITLFISTKLFAHLRSKRMIG